MDSFKYIVLVVVCFLGIESRAAIISYEGSATSLTAAFDSLFPTGLTVDGEFEFKVPGSQTSTDPNDLIGVSFALINPVGAGFCFSTMVYPEFCNDYTGPGALPVIDINEFNVTFDADGVPIDGLIRLGGLARSPWPYDMTFDISSGTFVWENLFGSASGVGSFNRPVPIPATALLLFSALGVLRVFGNRVSNELVRRV